MCRAPCAPTPPGCRLTAARAISTRRRSRFRCRESYGNAGRGTIIGPGTFTMNLQLARQIQLAERKSVEFNVSATNLLNHVNISGIGTVVNSLNYGLATAAGGMRTVSATVRLRF